MTKIMLFQARSVVNSSGGAEKVLCNMSNELIRRGYDVLTVCDEFSQGRPFYPLNEKVHFVNLSEKSKNPLKNIKTLLKRKLLPTSFRLKKFLEQEKPDIIICFFISDVYRIKFLHRVRTPIILMQHCYPDFYFQKMKKWNYYLNLFLLRNISAIQVLLPGYTEQIRSRLKKMNIVVIPNAVPVVEDNKTAYMNEHENKIVFVARMNKDQKRPHMLLEAFGKIAKDFPNWKVEFWGDGITEEYAEEMDALVIRYNLVGKVAFLGTTKDIGDIYENADIFAVTSTYEGFPLALTEAMSYGVAPIGFLNTTGVNELIQNGYNGVLTEDNIDSLSQGLKKLMENKEERIQYAKQAHQDMKAYSPEIVFNQWQDLIEQILKDF